MKIFACVGTNSQVIDNSNKSIAPQGYIVMKNKRPQDNYVAQADGSWVYQLDLAKEEKYQEIKYLLNQKEQAGFNYMDKVLDSDVISLQRITTVVQAAQVAISLGQDFNINWKTQDNSFLNMEAYDICGIPLALAKYNDNLHAKANGLKEQIDKATTKEELDSIVWE